jgi:LysM repeat protein
VVDRICPLLALAVDGRSVLDGVDPTHRCHAEAPALILDRRQQAAVCLTDAHTRCDRYLAHAARHAQRRPLPVVVGDGLISTRLVIAAEPAWRGMAGRARRWNATRVAAAGAGVALVAAGAVVVGSGVLNQDGSRREGTSAGVASRAPSPTPTQTPSPTLSPTPSPTPQVIPDTTPAATPLTPTPTPQPTYVVQEGDTLAAIAEQFGTTVEELQAANGIDDPNTINIGQVLVIP